ncbi:hypothetical protein FAGAP_9212 [Fusarium agapanthi]|uniref:Uncharacterized protein n=1 Tax=Fusarium agapanthi TaxID=1803897 RepID=A0A9P5B5F0_9HYPO|nr:hypothetical protein FAGAP_9212 [Fusarium agapanthi]
MFKFGQPGTIYSHAEWSERVRMLAPGRELQRHRNHKNRGRAFLIAVVLIFLVFNCRSLNVSSPSHLLAFPHRISRLHYLVPANVPNLQVCAVVTSALANQYSIPTILGYRGESFLDAQKAHIAKLRAIKDYLHNARGASDDLVIIVDGFDVLAQLPAEAMIQRYFTLKAEADQRLADRRGITVKELHRTGVRHTLLWGTDKGCWSESETDPRCWLVPFSAQPRLTWGLKTDTGDLQYNDSRFLNSGTVIGPLGDLRKFLDAALSLIEDDWDQNFLFRDSDQFYIAALYKRQEYQRMPDFSGGNFPGDIAGRDVPRPKGGKDDVTEYHITVDLDYTFTQTECHNYSLRLGTNIGPRVIFAFYHNTCDKAGFLDTFHDAWFYPLIRPLLRAAVRAIQHQHPINAESFDGRIWVAARQYPKRDLDEYGGVLYGCTRGGVHTTAGILQGVY